MKVDKPGSRPWIGVRVECRVCGQVGRVESVDKVRAVISRGSSTVEVTFELDCPCCGATIEAAIPRKSGFPPQMA